MVNIHDISDCTDFGKAFWSSKVTGHIRYHSSRHFIEFTLKTNVTSELTELHLEVISQYSDEKSSFPNEIPLLKPS